MSTLTVVGATGLVGSFFYNLVKTARVDGITKVTAVSRRSAEQNAPPSPQQQQEFNQFENVITSEITSSIPSSTKILFSGLGTTRGKEGGFENQYKVDYGLNVDIAKAAKAAGATTYVIVSASGANDKSYFAYPKMKAEIEHDVTELGFDRTIILRPGLILGHRNEVRSWEEQAAVSLYYGLKKLPFITSSLTNSTSAEAEDIAKAAIRAIQTFGPGLSIISNSEINALAREYDANLVTAN
ncbi:hypothetical protein V1514DRAFT_337452 [Lipomyces japonicus]|uniref:uncharacterized protein n=1 Tax=Lipomyces japonicus TaxID=56871 RepID=UPI0034CEB8C3